jgi:hypothetical protein
MRALVIFTKEINKMKTINDSYKLQLIDKEISNLNHIIIHKKVIKQQLISGYTQRSQRISSQLVSLLNINHGYELSTLFNVPLINNNDALICWVTNYLIENEEYQTELSLVNIMNDFQLTVARKQQYLSVEQTYVNN